MTADGFHLWILAAILCCGFIISGYGVSGIPIDFDPIAVALPNEAESSNIDNNDSAPLQYTLPDWLADINDPDVGPGVPYMPNNDDNSLKVISWDLVPPQNQAPETTTPHSGVGQQKKFHIALSPGQTFAFNRDLPVTTTTTTRRTTTTPRRTTTTTTTTTPRPTTIATTTTTTTTTTARPPSTTTTLPPQSVSSSNSEEYYTLPGGNSQFLPSWLEGYDDPELNIALPFEVPEDNNEYNHTLSLDLLPPFEPYEDLKTLSVPGLSKKPLSHDQAQTVAPISVASYPSTTITIPTNTRTTTIRPSPSSPTPFQYKFFSKQTVTPPTPTTQKPSFFTAPTAIPTTTESAISNRISQITLKSAAQPTGFRSNVFPAAQPTVAVHVKPTVPPLPVLNLKNNPFFSSIHGQSGFASFQTTTTTTTEAPTTSTSKEFLFDSATVPAWLSDAKDSALAPGIPFTLAEGSDSQHTDEQTIDGVTIQKSISSELPSFSFLHNSVPSQSIPTTQPFTATTVQEPSRLFTPPVVVVSDDDDNANLESQTNSISVNNFPAVTEPTTKTTSKVTFNKSDQGKVISNSVFAPQPTQQTSKPIFGQAQPAAPSGFTVQTTTAPGAYNKATTASAVFTGKYTGGFGGAAGTLGGQNKPGYAIQPDGSIVDPDHTVRPRVKVTVPPVPILVGKPHIDLPTLPKPAVTNAPKRAYTGTFGGPPGILLPFDNVKGGK